MRFKVQASVLLLPLLLLASIGSASAQTWVPGVAVGDYFTYEMYGVFTSNRSNTTLVIPEFEYNHTQWVRINITKVEGSIISQVYTLHFNNESEGELYFTSDVNPASKNNNVGQAVPICAANIEVDVCIPTAQLTIDDSTSKSYGDGAREINHASWNDTDDWGNCYFDRQTGMLVEFRRTHRFINYGTGEIVEKTDVINLLSTNRWELNAFPLPTMLYLAILAASVFSLLFLVLITYLLVAKTTHNRPPAYQ